MDKPSAKTILMIEDNPDYSKTLKDIIESLTDHTVTVAPNGMEGMKLAKTHQYDLFLVDVNLPDSLGWDISRVLRNSKKYHTTPIIVMTAEDNVETRKLSLRSGCNIYLPKPVDIDALTDLLGMYLAGSAPPPPPPSFG